MKRVVVLLVLSAAVAGIAAAVSGSPGETPWFDPQNCAVCKNLADQPGLLEHIQMNTFSTGQGMIDVCTVDPKFMAEYQTAKAGMNAAIQKMMAGEKLPLDGCCMSYGAMAAAGAKIESFDTPDGSITVVSSADPKLVEMIHAHAMKSVDEMKKMKSMTDHEGSGEGK